VPRRGEIVEVAERWEEPAGGGGVAAVVLARLAGGVEFFTALGDDELGRRAREELTALGVRVHTAAAGKPQRRGIVYLDASGARTITVIGEKLRPRAQERLPWEALDGADAVFWVAGDAAGLRLARRAQTVVATARDLPVLREACVELDALVGSGDDEAERYRPGDLDPAPRLVVTTAGALGGWAQPGGPYRAVPPPGPVEDDYGAGDSFMAGLTYALATGTPRDDALAFAAACGAEALTRRGAHGRPRARV
jgi:ribokinase